MFSSPLFWQIQNLVSSLTKKNHQTNTLELNKLIMLYGDEANSFLSATLFDEIDFRDQKSSNLSSSRDAQKISMLQEEISRALLKLNAVSCICQAFEGGERGKILQQAGGRLPEDYISNICKTLQLSPIQVCGFVFALTQSQFPSVSQDSLSILKSKLAEVDSVTDLSEHLIHRMATFIARSEDLSHGPVSENFMKAVKNSPFSAIFGKLEKAVETNMTSIRSLSSSVRKHISIASTLADFGTQCSMSVETFSATLSDIGITMDEAQLGEMLVTFVAHNKDSRSTSTDEDLADGSGSWNLEVIANVLSSKINSTTNWATVVRKFDQPNISLSNDSFQILAQLLIRISGKALAAEGLLDIWDNRILQLSMIVFSCNSSRAVVDFTKIFQQESRMDLGDIPSPSNLSWMCLPLYTTLINLANSGMSYEVMQVLISAATTFPEYVTVCLAQVQDPTSGIRSEVLRRTLPLFTGCVGARSTSIVVMKKLAEVNPDVLVVLIRLGFKRATTTHEILTLDARKQSLGAFGRRIDEEASPDEMLGYWCILADKSDFNLERKLNSVLEQNMQFAKSLFVLAKKCIESLRPKTAEGGILSLDSFGLILRILLQNCASVIPADDIRALGAAATAYQQQQQQQQQQQGPADRTRTTPQQVTPNDAEDVEELANSYFQKIYTSEFTITEVIALLKRFKSSAEHREQEIFRCMIHNLFDEYRFFHKYPERELQVTGRLFGTLIQHQLVSSITLGIALRYILEALRKDPEQGGSNEKMFRFGKISLEQFRSRLHEWPQYCSHLIQIPHLERYCPDLFQEAQRAISSPGPQAAQPTVSNPSAIETSQEIVQQQNQLAANNNQVVSNDPYSSVGQISSQMQNLNVDEYNKSPKPAIQFAATSPKATLAQQQQQQQHVPPLSLSGGDTSARAIESKAILSTNHAHSAQSTQDEAQGTVEIDRMALVNVEATSASPPPEVVRDKVHFIINNVAKANLEMKSSELKGILLSDHFNWFANYLVVKRISTQANLHPLYLAMLDYISSEDLTKALLNSVFYNVTKLLQSSKITTSSSERSLLRNLGIWLGQVTLAKNRPLLQRRINLKELLLWGYESGRLIAVCSFVAKIIEGVKDSKIFRPPNPWLMSILGILRELFEIEDLKMNIKFEVQVLFKNVNIRLEDIPKADVLASRRIPSKEKNPDFNVKSSAQVSSSANNIQHSPLVSHSPTMRPIVEGSEETSAASNSPAGGHSMLPHPAASNATNVQPANTGQYSAQTPSADSSLQTERTVIPNLASYIKINQSLAFFAKQPMHCRIVPLAVDRAIREIIQPVVERSVSIACVTTKQLILKDYALEPNEISLRNAAHLMVSNLAGSLALITCKEPLRLSIGNHLRSLLGQVTNDAEAIEQIIQVCSSENLDLGCILIEKAATEKALRDVDDSLASSIQARRKHRETGQPFVDSSIPKGSRYPRELPEMLKPKAGGLHPQQLLVYEGFQRQRSSLSSNTNNSASTSSTSSNQGASMQSLPISQQIMPNAQQTPLYTMSQALEAYQNLLAAIENSVKNVILQAKAREMTVTLSMLGNENEIILLIREIMVVTQRIQPAMRTETAMTFAERIFKLLVEGIDSLRQEVLAGILEALREACGGIKKFNPDVISWLDRHASFNMNDELGCKLHRTVLILLLRAKLLKCQDVDNYFARYMDGGRNMIWVELALSFVRQCLIEGIAATFEFSNTFEIVSQMRPVNSTVRKQLQKWISDLKTLATTIGEQKKLQQQQQSSVEPATAPAGATNTAAPAPTPSTASSISAVREHVAGLLDRWLRIWGSVNENYQLFIQYLQLLQQYGILKTEEPTDRFFKVAVELCVEAFAKIAGPSNTLDASLSVPVQHFQVIDALSKLFLLLVRITDKESGSLLGRILNAIMRALMEDHEQKKASNAIFDQRAYFRMLSNLCQDLGVPDAKTETNPALMSLLGLYTQLYINLQPVAVPAFSFAWLQLVSQKSFMPQLLLLKGQKGWPHVLRLLSCLLVFLHPFLKSMQMNEAVRKLYKGTLRVLLALLHDFPDFLCQYHLPFCDLIPTNCMQLRNLVLSAFPRNMRVPDPFTPNLKVDTLPEIAQTPVLLSDFSNMLNEVLRARLDAYVSTRQTLEVNALIYLVAAKPTGGSKYNLPLFSAIIVYLAVQTIALDERGNMTVASVRASAAYEMYQHLLGSVDSEGRYYIINSMANQLRYPNNQTHFFSCVLLSIFTEASANDEFLQEQITRVVFERLIVQKPHPWGLLVTFIELIKNPLYDFWNKPFTKCAPEIEEVFKLVAKSCVGPAAAASIAASSNNSNLSSKSSGGATA